MQIYLMLENYFREGMVLTRILCKKFEQLICKLKNDYTVLRSDLVIKEEYTICKRWLPLVSGYMNNDSIYENGYRVCYIKQNSS